MSFSFNWAGVNIPQAAVEPNASIQARSRADGAAWGNALRGYVNDRGMKEYAAMIENAQRDSDPRIMAIEAEISKLEARNAELQRMQLAAQQQQGQMDGYVPSQAMPAYGAARQMGGYGAYMQGMQDQGMAQNAAQAILDAQRYRTR